MSKEKTENLEFGGYNDTPPGWREISEEDFAKSKFFQYDHERMENRNLIKAGIRDEKGFPLTSAMLFFFWDSTGIGIMNDFWAGRVRYFAFGCDHQYREVYGNEASALGIGPLYRCEHAYICDKCGVKRVVDSSD